MPKTLVHVSIALLVLVGLILLDFVPAVQTVLDWGRLGANFLETPLFAMFAKINDFLVVVSRLHDLATENGLLTQQVAKLNADLVGLEQTTQENQILRAALEFQNNSNLSLVPAEIIGWDSLDVSEKATLDRGQRQGIAVGTAVVAPPGVFVGVITKVSDNTSQMDLVTSSNVKVIAEVTPSGARGVVQGEHGVGLTFNLGSLNEVINPGDKILTSGLGGQFPKNLLIGEVNKVTSSRADLFQQASVTPAISLRDLRAVFIIKK